MQSPNPLSLLSPGQKPREGQLRVLKQIMRGSTSINVKLPTGYGKTFTAAWAYSFLKQQGKVNRLLLVFPSISQLNQFKEDGEAVLAAAGVTGEINITDVSFYGKEAILRHRKNESQVFVITVQALCNSRGMINCKELMETGCWMICIDEYHHYGLEKSWGLSVLNLPRSFLLAMSATPTRPGEDSAFGRPDISVSYREAAKEGAVKELRGHSYAYKIDTLTPDGDIQSYTTSDLIKELGTSDPNRMEKVSIERKMRWSPKYVSPLVAIPIERMLADRCATGHRLQVLVNAMCVSHAKMVKQQIADMFPNLEVDWIGTGDYGRPAEENEIVLRKFCPPKDKDGNRPQPTIDVLVHVGMAGEGLDSINVSEVVHLNSAKMCNKRLQENGRAARVIKGVDGLEGHINFDSSSDFSEYVGDAIMDAMDDNPPNRNTDDDPPGDPNEPRELPEEPVILKLNLELLYIDSGTPGVRRMLQTMCDSNIFNVRYNYEDLISKPDHPAWQTVIEMERTRLAAQAKPIEKEAEIKQVQEQVDNATGALAIRAVRLTTREGVSFDRSLIGDMKRRINTQKKKACGKMVNSLEVAKAHYRWVKRLEQEIIHVGAPEWLLS